MRMGKGESDTSLLDQAIDLLMVFTRTGKAMGAVELQRLLGFSPAAIAEILQTLDRRGWIEQVREEGLYRPGSVFLLLAGAAQRYTDLREEALPLMRELRAVTGETVTLNAVLEGERVCIEKAETAHRLRHVVYIGERTPLRAEASGQLLLAYMPQEGLDERLRGELADIRARGYAASREGAASGVAVIAAPVRDNTRSVVASLGLLGPESRLLPERLPTLTDALVQTALRLSERLGYAMHA